MYSLSFPHTTYFLQVHIAAHKRSALPQLICRCAAGSTNHNSPPETIGKCRLPPASDTGGVTPQRRWNAVCLAYLGDGVWEVSVQIQHGILCFEPLVC